MSRTAVALAALTLLKVSLIFAWYAESIAQQAVGMLGGPSREGTMIIGAGVAILGSLLIYHIGSYWDEILQGDAEEQATANKALVAGIVVLMIGIALLLYPELIAQTITMASALDHLAWGITLAIFKANPYQTVGLALATVLSLAFHGALLYGCWPMIRNQETT